MISCFFTRLTISWRGTLLSSCLETKPSDKEPWGRDDIQEIQWKEESHVLSKTSLTKLSSDFSLHWHEWLQMESISETLPKYNGCFLWVKWSSLLHSSFSLEHLFSCSLVCPLIPFMTVLYLSYQKNVMRHPVYLQCVCSVLFKRLFLLFLSRGFMLHHDLGCFKSLRKELEITLMGFLSTEPPVVFLLVVRRKRMSHIFLQVLSGKRVCRK
jgi:hypothetical protein